MTMFELCKAYLKIQANKLAEIHNYSWDDDFKIKEINEFFETFKQKGGYKDINLSELTKEELISLGGSIWSDEVPDMVLIPLWMLFFLPDELECCEFDGVMKKMKKSELDNDHRFGCLAYGYNYAK